tara:strand:+ start:457 stop:1245 length:789 start_codon:yes stop_codon:yes gene_type:complete
MLVICNGTFKSGSSWMHAIVLEIFRIKDINTDVIPINYNPDIKSPTRILENNLPNFLKNEDFKKFNYITKAHYFSNKVMIEKYSTDVRFIFITRNVKDAIVSHFHHFNNYRNKGLGFNRYFKFIGVFKAYEICLCNSRYKNNFDSNLFFSFEMLKSDFIDSVKKLCLILGVSEISTSEILKIKENTSLSKMMTVALEGGNRYYPELGVESHKLFRKGNIGDWKQYFIDSDLKLINRVIQLDPPLYVVIGYFFIFTLRRKFGF